MQLAWFIVCACSCFATNSHLSCIVYSRGIKPWPPRRQRPGGARRGRRRPRRWKVWKSAQRRTDYVRVSKFIKVCTTTCFLGRKHFLCCFIRSLVFLHHAATCQGGGQARLVLPDVRRGASRVPQVPLLVFRGRPRMPPIEEAWLRPRLRR